MSASAASSRCAAIFLPLAMILSAAIHSAEPPITVEREPLVPMPNATRSVSPSMYCTSFGSMPSRSLSTCLNVGLVPLALVLAAHQQGDVAARVEADLGEFLARRRPPSRSGWRCRCRAVCRAACASSRRAAKPVPIGERQRLFLVGREIAAVVVERRARSCTGIFSRGIRFLRAQLDPVDARVRAPRRRSAAR